MGISIAMNYVPVECCACHISFALTADTYRRRKNDGKDFFCPMGHRQHFTESDTKKLQRQLEEANRRVSEQAARASIAEQHAKESRAAHQRMRKRIQQGVCPCCNRHFENLMRHMQSQHAGSQGERLRVARLHTGLTQEQLAKEAQLRRPINASHVSLFERGLDVTQDVADDLTHWLENNA